MTAVQFTVVLISSFSSLALHLLKMLGILSLSFLNNPIDTDVTWSVSSSLPSLLAKLAESVPIIKSLSHLSLSSPRWWSSIFCHSLYCELTFFFFVLGFLCVAPVTGNGVFPYFFDSPVPFRSAIQHQFLVSVLLIFLTFSSAMGWGNALF